jgi:DNA mismatch repair ATPase MutS
VLRQAALDTGIGISLTDPDVGLDIERHCDAFKPSLAERIPGLSDYANLFLLYEYAKVARDVHRFRRGRAALQRLCLAVGECEMQIVMSEHFARWRGPLCVPQLAAGRPLCFAAIVHPLVRQASPVDLALPQDKSGLLLTGANGVGKSTLLRAIGLNVLLAKAYGVCYARQASLPTLLVQSSLQSEDSLAEQESLYMAELRRASELLRSAACGPQHLLLVDEIFRGTNALESTAAAAAVVRELCRSGAIPIVSSHNLILGQLVRRHLHLAHLARVTEGAQPLMLLPGLMAEPNGLALMQDYGFPPSVHDLAGSLRALLVAFEMDPRHFQPIP